MGQFLDSIKKSNETTVKKVSENSTTTKGTSRSGVFDDVFAETKPNQSMIPTPLPVEFKSYNSEATKNGKKDISTWSRLGGLLKKAGAPVLNYLQNNRREGEVANFKLRQSMYPDRNDPMRTIVDQDGNKKRTNDAIEAYDNAKTDEERAAVLAADTAEIPLIKFLNSPTGKKVTKTIAEKTSNIPLKIIAKYQTIGDEIYEAFTDPSFKNAWDVVTATQLNTEGTESNKEKFKSRLDPLIAESVDETNPRWQKILYGVQNSGVQSAIGAVLSVGTSYLTRNPRAGQAVGTAYFGSISAEGERQKYEDGNIDNPAALGNIAIDTIGDQMLSGIAEATLRNFAREGAEATLTSILKKGTQGFVVEGGTESTQSLLKYANDYTAARTETEKTAISDSFADYIKSGALLDEFLIGGIAGAGINLTATGAGTIVRPVVTKTGEELSPEKVESIKDSITEQVDTALDSGDFSAVVESVAQTNNLTEEAADTLVRDAAQDIIAENVDREAPVDSPEYTALQTDITTLLKSGVNPADISIGLQEQASVSSEYANTAVATAVANEQTQKAEATAPKPTVETVVQKNEKAETYITQKLTESEVESDVIKNVAPSLVVAISGRGTAAQKQAAIDLLADPANESSRALYESEMGFALPADEAESRAILQREINKSKTRKMAEFMVWQELDQSEADYRVFLPQNDTNDLKVEGVPSTFPKWIPEELRSKDLFKKVSPTIETGKRPKEGKTAYKQAQLYDLIQERISQYEADLENNAYDIAEPTPDVDPNIPFQVANNQIQSESLISKVEAEAIVRQYFSADEVSVDFVKSLRTPRGIEAWGKYSNSVITFIENPRADTPHHESVHAFLDLFVAQEDRAKFLKTAYDEQVTRLGEDKVKADIANLAKRYNDKLDTDRVKALYAEEALADGFTEYVNGRNEKTALQQFFDRVIAFIKSIGGTKDAQRLYEDIIARKRSKKAEYERQMRKVKEGFDSFSEKEVDTTDTEIYLRAGQPKLGVQMIQKEDGEWVSVDTIVARERFNIPKLTKVSFGGSDRDVYAIGDNAVIKVVKTPRGIAQNDASHDYYAEDQGLTPKTIEVGKNYVVKERVLSPDANVKKMIAELKKLDTVSLVGRVGGYDKSQDERSKAYEIMEKYGYSGWDLANYDVLWGDVTAIRNWGTTKEGKPIMLDEGTLNGDLVLGDIRRSNAQGSGNLSDPEFRDIYNASRAAKKASGDTDTKTMYSEKEPISMTRSKTYSVQPFKNLTTKVPEFKKARAANSETHAYTMGKESVKIDSAKLQKIEGKTDGMYTESYAVIVDDSVVFISEKIEDSAKWLADNAGKSVSIEQNATATVFTDGNDAYAIVTSKDLIPLEIGNIQGTTNVLTIKFYDTRGQIIETHAITGDGTFKPLSLTAEATRNNSTRITFPSYFAAIAGRPVLVKNDTVDETQVTRVDRDQTSQMPVEPNLNDPKIKKSRAYEKARERLVEQYQEDVTYTAVKIDDQMAKAFELVDTNFEYAKAVALGLEQPPLDITDTAISIAVSERAKDTKDYQLQADTEKARSLRQSRRGQELVLERGRVDENSPEYFIRELIERRKHLAQNKYKPILSRVKAFTEILEERVTEAKKKGVKKLKSDLEIKGETLDDFLREMAC